MKKKLLLTVLLAAFLLSAMSLNAQSYFEDTVWTKKTDQMSGFYQVEFSNNHSIIVGHGYENAIIQIEIEEVKIAQI